MSKWSPGLGIRKQPDLVSSKKTAAFVKTRHFPRQFLAMLGVAFEVNLLGRYDGHIQEE